MTKQELIEKISSYPDDMEVVIMGEQPNLHYEISDVDVEYDDDYEDNVIVLYS